MSQIYLKNKDLYEEIIISKENGILTKKAESMFILLGQRTIKKFRYPNPADREDCLQMGLCILFLNWNNFDPEKGTNAFAYFTEVFKRGAVAGFNSLYKHKGDPDKKIKMISIDSTNSGEGLYNL